MSGVLNFISSFLSDRMILASLALQHQAPTKTFETIKSDSAP